MRATGKFIFLLCILILNLQTCAFAGNAGGPYVIWINLSNNRAIDEMVAKHIAEKDECIPPNAVFLLNSRPNGITNELVSKAVIENDKASISLLEKIMRRPFDILRKGFDGIIAYDDSKYPRFSSVVTGWHAVATEKIPKGANSESIWASFCVLIPPITRAP
jgi:hypothetical protein